LRGGSGLEQDISNHSGTGEVEAMLNLFYLQAREVDSLYRTLDEVGGSHSDMDGHRLLERLSISSFLLCLPDTLRFRYLSQLKGIFWTNIPIFEISTAGLGHSLHIYWGDIFTPRKIG
jgi:hypothetical protein